MLHLSASITMHVFCISVLFNQAFCYVHPFVQLASLNFVAFSNMKLFY